MSCDRSCKIKAICGKPLTQETLSMFFSNMKNNNIDLFGTYYENQEEKFESDEKELIKKILSPSLDLNYSLFHISGSIAQSAIEKDIYFSFYFKHNNSNSMIITMFSEDTLNGWKITSQDGPDIPDIAKYSEIMCRLSKGLDLIDLHAEIDVDY